MLAEEHIGDLLNRGEGHRDRRGHRRRKVSKERIETDRRRPPLTQKLK